MFIPEADGKELLKDSQCPHILVAQLSLFFAKDTPGTSWNLSTKDVVQFHEGIIYIWGSPFNDLQWTEHFHHGNLP